MQGGPDRRGYPGGCWGATDNRGTLDKNVTLHYRGASNHTGAPRISREGFLRRAGLFHLLGDTDMSKQLEPITTRGQSQSDNCGSSVQARSPTQGPGAARPELLASVRGTVMWF